MFRAVALITGELAPLEERCIDMAQRGYALGAELKRRKL